MSKEQFLSFLQKDPFSRASMPESQEQFVERLWDAYRWGLKDGTADAFDRLASFLKDTIG